MPPHLRQVPHPPARQRCGRRGAAGRVLPQRAEDARSDQREEMAAAEPLEEPGAAPTRRAEPAFPVEPASVQSLHAQGEPGTALGLSLRRSHGQVSGTVDGSIAVAALTLVSENRRHVDPAPGRHFELLSDQGSLWGGRGGQREHSHADQPRARLSEPPLPTPEGQADGRGKYRIHRCSHGQESSLKWPIRQILAQSAKAYAITCSWNTQSCARSTRLQVWL